MSLRSQTLGEEIANSVSHGIGLVASLAAAPFLIGAMLRRGDAMLILAAGIFAVTVVLLYLSSTLYHAIPESRAKRVLQVIDHSAIYLLIAGTYTPFALGVLRGPWGWTLLTVVWLLAAVGVALKATRGIVWPRLSTALYLGMGWLALVAVRPIMREVPLPGLLWITAGGLAYTAGVAFFAADHRCGTGISCGTCSSSPAPSATTSPYSSTPSPTARRTCDGQAITRPPHPDPGPVDPRHRARVPRTGGDGKAAGRGTPAQARRGRFVAQEIEALRGEMDDMRRELGEVQERLDFAERLLARPEVRDRAEAISPEQPR